MAHCKAGFASVVLDLMIGSWPGDRSTEDWRTYSAHSTLLTLDILSALDKTGVYAYVNMTAYLGEPCNIHKFASVTFGFVLSWLRKTPGGTLITILRSDLNSFLIMGSLIQYFGGNASLSLTLVSSRNYCDLVSVHPAPDHQTAIFVPQALRDPADDLNHFKPMDHV